MTHHSAGDDQMPAYSEAVKSGLYAKLYEQQFRDEGQAEAGALVSGEGSSSSESHSVLTSMRCAHPRERERRARRMPPTSETGP